jgi:hypothetical protein
VQSGAIDTDIIRVAMPLSPGTKIDGYEIVGLLGAGGMGEVYRARESALKRDVAIKVLPGFVSQDPDRLRRFTQEAQAAAALNHPNILAVYGLGSFASEPYLVSELLDAVPVVEFITQLTGDSKPKRDIYTDGSRIYFEEGQPSRNIAQVSVAGGPSVPLDTKLENPFLVGLVRDGSALLGMLPSGSSAGPVWSIPLPAGEPRRLGSTLASDADVLAGWAPGARRRR